jgi:hypothetical protein
MAALMAAPVAPAAQLAQLTQAAGLNRAAAGWELPALEKAGRTAGTGARPGLSGRPGTSPRRHQGRTARTAVQLRDRRGGHGHQDTEAPGAGDPDFEEDAGSAALASPVDIAPGADEALSAVAAAAAQAETALQAREPRRRARRS